MLNSSDVFARSFDSSVVIGAKVRIGGRFDNVRKCVASKLGTKGGIAADISLCADVPLNNSALFHIDLPVMRPILFGIAFKMLQFEPTVSLRFVNTLSDQKQTLQLGPSLGVSLHYGPDYKSETKGDGRTGDFFAMGPIIGGYAGITFNNSEGRQRQAFGLSPYITPLYSINDSQNHRGVVIGGLLDYTLFFGRKQ